MKKKSESIKITAIKSSGGFINIRVVKLIKHYFFTINRKKLNLSDLKIYSLASPIPSALIENVASASGKHGEP